MDKVIAADAVPVAVSARHDDLQLMIGQLGAGRHRQSAAMQGMHAIRVEIAGQVRRAADAADGQDLVRLEPRLDDCLLQSREHAEIAASGTPVGIDLAFEILDRHLDAFGLNQGGHRRLLQTWISCTGTYSLVEPSRMALTPSTRWCGMNGSPSYFRM